MYACACLFLSYETQLELLRLVSVLACAYAAAAFAMRLSRSFDAARVLTMASMATLADVLVRFTLSRMFDFPKKLG